MNSTSLGEGGGNVARVDGGSVRVGWPGAPGWTITGGVLGPACCALADDRTDSDNKHTSAPVVRTALRHTFTNPTSPFLATATRVLLVYPLRPQTVHDADTIESSIRRLLFYGPSPYFGQSVLPFVLAAAYAHRVTCVRPTRYPIRVDREEIIRVLRAFEVAGLEYVLIGATAMAFHGLVRATEDLDILIRATPENVERLRAALRRAYDEDPNISDISSTDLLGEYPAVRYYPPTGDIYVDVLTRLGEASSFETVEAEVKEIDGTKVIVATPNSLYRMKKSTIRLQDRADAAALRERFDLKEEI